MKIAYLVLAHANPRHLARAIKALQCESCAFFVHIDRKSDVRQFSGIRSDQVFVVEPRVPVYWGQFSQIEAILILLRRAIQHRDDFQYFTLISGADYPLRSAAYIRSFLTANQGLEFISAVHVPNDRVGKPLCRINTRVLSSDKPIRRFATRVLAKFGLARRDYRKYLGGLEPYSGSEWWTLSRAACQYLIEFVDNNPAVVNFFTEVCAADEALFQTILFNSPYRPRLRRNLMYDDWSAGGCSPAMITAAHVAFFESQERVWASDHYGSGELLFARKFSDRAVPLLERIDNMIARRESLEPCASPQPLTRNSSR